MLSNMNITVALAITSETLELMWLVPLFGIFMVFAVLTVLWGVLTLFKFIFATPVAKKKADTEEVTREIDAVAPEKMIEGGQNAEELVAVITAAVAAYIADEDPAVAQSGFKVVSFRRANGGRSWNLK